MKKQIRKAQAKPAKRQTRELPLDFLESHDEKSIIAELRRVAAMLRRRKLSESDINQCGRIRTKAIALKFGSVRAALEAAGLMPTKYVNPTDEDLMRVIADLWVKTLRNSGRRPMKKDLKDYDYPVTGQVISERFGTWKKALIATANTLGWPEREMAVVRRQAGKAAIPAKRRKPISDRKRFLVLKRDNYTCLMCRKPGGELEIDHILPVCRGGPDTLDNLQALCRNCNRGKRGSLQ